jgi:hypothetical protein
MREVPRPPLLLCWSRRSPRCPTRRDYPTTLGFNVSHAA